MAKPPVFYHDWTYWVPVNFLIACYLDINIRLHLLLKRPGMGYGAWWATTFEERLANRLGFREEAARICERHELIRFQSIEWEDEEL